MRENSEWFWLLHIALVSVQEPVSVVDAPLRSALIREGEDKRPQMLLVLE